MSIFKSAKERVLGAAKVGGEIAGEALKVAGGALNETAKFATRHQETVASKTQSVLTAGARSLQAAGDAITAKADDLSQSLAHHQPAPEQKAQRFLQRAGDFTVTAVGGLGQATRKAGSYTEKASPVIGAATGSAISGFASTVSGAFDSVAITEQQFEKLRTRLQDASAPIKEEADRRNASILAAQEGRRKRDLLDLVVIGGVTLADIVADPAKTPPDVERAFELAYPGLVRGGETFADAVERIPSDDLLGLVSGVKGKLFEIELVDHLNDGGLADGLHAELAGSATQPGFDIQILDSHNQVVDVLQAKATESVAYVQAALERYPDIDITTTSEVHAQLMALGSAELVTNSGISEHLLEQKVQAAIASGDQLDMGDLLPSSIGMAVIALSSFLDKSLTPEERGIQFGDRAAKASVSGAAAKAALIMTNAWWVALTIGIGSRWLSAYGGNKRQRYELLEKAVETMEAKTRQQNALPRGRTRLGFQA